MYIVSSETFFLWKQKQIMKGGDDKSLNLLIDSLGGLSKKELSLLKVKSEKCIPLKINLDLLESLWDKHLTSSIPIQYLSEFLLWDLKLEVSKSSHPTSRNRTYN